MASKFLQDLFEKPDPERNVNVFVKASGFNMPLANTVVPTIMVGPGTGVVPFIGFIEER